MVVIQPFSQGSELPGLNAVPIIANCESDIILVYLGRNFDDTLTIKVAKPVEDCILYDRLKDQLQHL
ncbi:hypothetical protein D3C71_1788600 [compost metagenome]